MRKLTFLLLAILSINMNAGAAKNYNAFNVGIGYNFVDLTTEMIDNVRAYKNDYGYDWYDCYYGNLSFESVGSGYLNFSFEHYFTYKVSVASGLRLSMMKSSYSTDNDFFYYKLKEDGYNTYYYRVNSIDQNSFFAGIPLEFRFTTRADGRPTPYLRACAVLNFNVGNVTKAHMNSDDSKKSKIEDKVGSPDFFSMPAYIGVGWMFGHKNSISAEFQFPYFVVFGSMSPFGKTDGIGCGFQITYQFSKNDLKEEKL